MQPHLTSYHGRLLTKTRSFFLILGVLRRLDELLQPCQSDDETAVVKYDVWYYVVMPLNGKYGSLFPACSFTDILFFFLM